MLIKKALIERGKMGKDRIILNLNTLILPEDEYPVYLNNENVDKEPIGTAKIYLFENFLYSDIDLPSNKAYLKMFPSIAVSLLKPENDYKSFYRGNLYTINEALLIGIVLSKYPNLDPRIPIIGKKLVN